MTNTASIISQIEKDWRSRGFSCDLWTDPPGQVWKDFVHNTDELLTVIDGDLEVEIAGNPLHPKPGEEIFIPAGATHTVRNIGRVTSHWLYGYKIKS